MNQLHANGTPVHKWPLISRVFHWISALLLVVTWVLMFLYNTTDDSFYISLHKAFGVSLLFCMLARVIGRVSVTAPPAVAMPKWQDVISKLNHFVLYALLIAMPILGLLMSVYGGRAVDMFGLFEIPVFVTPDRGLARTFNDWHTDIVAPMIIAFTAVHIFAALYHQYVKKDKLMKRMW